ASHLLLTPPRGEAWVVELLHRVGREAMARGAPDSAGSYLRRALDEGVARGDQRTQLLFELGGAEVLINGPAASEHLQQAYDRLTDPGMRGLAAGLLGRALMFTGRPVQAREVPGRALADL